MRAEIARRLDELAHAEQMDVLLAVESGSRAWGFHSPDSDYDVRFIYRRPLKSYLPLGARRDVVERPIVDEIDLAGWDLDKALKLAMRGNAVAHEWLASPITYGEAPGFRQGFDAIARRWRARFTDAAHYYGLLRTQHARFIQGRAVVKLKKYFYVVRPALALHWLRERGQDALPMDLPSLLDGVAMASEARGALERLRSAKALGLESAEGPRIEPLDDYVEEQAAWGLRAKARPAPADAALIADTEDYFHALIMERP
jgi:predicted nucleotidyltransferase